MLLLSESVVEVVSSARAQRFPGRDGGDSQISQGSTVLVFAGGGKGGTQGTLEHLGVAGGGCQADPNAMISHDGLASTSFQGGPGGKAYNENLTPNGILGEGGPGTCTSRNTA